MDRYETTFILTPALSDEQTKETIARFKKLLIDNGVEILNGRIWGLRKLAYNVQKESPGLCALLEFSAGPMVIDTPETGFHHDEKVICYITVRQDKHSAAYAEKRHAKWATKREA